MAKTALQHIRQGRAEAKLELALWDIINQPKFRTETKTESILNRVDIMRVLLGMAARIAMELQRGKH